MCVMDNRSKATTPRRVHQHQDCTGARLSRLRLRLRLRPRAWLRCICSGATLTQTEHAAVCACKTNGSSQTAHSVQRPSSIIHIQRCSAATLLLPSSSAVDLSGSALGLAYPCVLPPARLDGPAEPSETCRTSLVVAGCSAQGSRIMRPFRTFSVLENSLGEDSIVQPSSLVAWRHIFLNFLYFLRTSCAISKSICRPRSAGPPGRTWVALRVL